MVFAPRPSPEDAEDALPIKPQHWDEAFEELIHDDTCVRLLELTDHPGGVGSPGWINEATRVYRGIEIQIQERAQEIADAEYWARRRGEYNNT